MVCSFLVSLFLMMCRLGADCLTGLHLTPDGYRIVYEEVMKVIRANWPDQTPEQLSRVFPGWQDAPK